MPPKTDPSSPAPRRSTPVRALGSTRVGVRAELVTVEACFEPADRGGTSVVLTGLPDPVLRESRGRLLTALASSGLRVPMGRLHLNLVPAARPKSGAGLELPLALAAVTAIGHLQPEALEGCLFLAEVGLDGELHGVPGGLPGALAAHEAGVSRVVAATASAREAAVVDGLDVREADTLDAVVAALAGGAELPRATAPDPDPDLAQARHALDAIRGHAAAKAALVIAAAGGHGLLMTGPPGSGKSMLAKALASLLPGPTRREQLEITTVLSAAGAWPRGLARRRPFRAPHPTASTVGLIGGGPTLAPGEVSLAHRGVLFLDELPEFRREALESLRQPLEDGRIHLARAGRRAELPARFLLVAAMNPCPCGYRGHPRRPCSCPPTAVQRYRQRVSGPLLDRIDLRLEVLPPDAATLAGAGEPAREGQATAAAIGAVERALQRRRARGQTTANGRLDPAGLDRHVPLAGPARALFLEAAERRALSARALQSVRRVARTLADVADAEAVGPEHVAGALGLRAPLALGAPYS